MATTIDKPTLLQRVLPLFRGFDGWLVAIVLMLAGVGLVAMYSAGYDHGTRAVSLALFQSVAQELGATVDDTQ